MKYTMFMDWETYKDGNCPPIEPLFTYNAKQNASRIFEKKLAVYF